MLVTIEYFLACYTFTKLYLSHISETYHTTLYYYLSQKRFGRISLFRLNSVFYRIKLFQNTSFSDM